MLIFLSLSLRARDTWKIIFLKKLFIIFKLCFLRLSLLPSYQGQRRRGAKCFLGKICPFTRWIETDAP